MATATQDTRKRRRVAQERKRLDPESTDPAVRFALRLRSLLDRHGLTAESLALKLTEAGVDVDRPAVESWLRGGSMPRAKHLEALGGLFYADYRHILPPPLER